MLPRPIEPAVLDARLEELVGGVDHVDVGHEQHRGSAVRPQHEQGGDPVLLEAAEADPAAGEEILHEGEAGAQLLRPRAGALEAHEGLGEVEDVHPVISFQSRSGAISRVGKAEFSAISRGTLPIQRSTQRFLEEEPRTTMVAWHSRAAFSTPSAGRPT